MLWHQKPDILSKSGNKVNVKFCPSTKTKDITDHLRPAVRKKYDAIIIHASTNDLTNDVNTMKHVRSITKIIEEMKGGGDIQVGFSEIIERRDDEKIKVINERLKSFCNSKGFLFIDESSIDEDSLHKTLSCLSWYGNRLFWGYLINALKGFYLTDMYTNDTDDTKHLSTANTDISQILKGLCLSYPKNVTLSYLNVNSVRNKFKNLR